MFHKVDAENFGSFHNFEWNTAVQSENGTPASFKKLNIIYGRNYSGKTTLSRIFRSAEIGALPEKYDSPKFRLSGEQETVTEADVATCNQSIRVYNSDFVKENLKFLQDATGDIKPFAILGSENRLTLEKIETLEKAIGGIESKNGLRQGH